MTEPSGLRPEPPAPYAVALLICDGVHTDPATGKKTLLGLFTTMASVQFPARLGNMAIYIAVTDGRDVTPIRVVLVDSQEERDPIFQGDFEINFPDPFVVVELILNTGIIDFPEPGEYRLQLFASNVSIMERRLLMVAPPENPHA